jgi:hypothetical protein
MKIQTMRIDGWCPLCELKVWKGDDVSYWYGSWAHIECFMRQREEAPTTTSGPPQKADRRTPQSAV